MASFRQVLSGVADAYRNRREDVLRGPDSCATCCSRRPGCRGRGR